MARDSKPEPAVLVVDDDPGLASLIDGHLTRMGCRVSVARCGEAALEWFETQSADLMLLDLKLPDMSGQQVVERLQQKHPPVPFIVITGQGDERVAVDMMKRGARDYLVKDTALFEWLPTVVQRTINQIRQDRRLAEAERNLKLTAFAVENAAEAMFTVAPDGRILDANDVACRRLEYSREQLQALRVFEVDPTLCPETWPDHWEAVRRAGRLVREAKHLTRTRREIPVEVAIGHFQYEGSEYCCAFARDISERLRVTEALRRSEDLLRKVFESIPVGLWVADRNFVLQLWNAGQERITGRPRESVLGRNIFELFPSLTRCGLEKLYRNVVESGEPLVLDDFPFHDPTLIREQYYLNISAIPLRGEDHRVNGIVAAVEDITQQRQTERSLRESEERFRYVVKATRDHIWDWSIPERKVWRSEAFYGEFGPPDEADQLGWWLERLHPEDRDRVLGHVESILSSDAVNWTQEYRLRRPDGTYAHVIDRAFVIRDREGRAVRAIGALTDVTERTRAESALRESEEKLRSFLDNVDDMVYYQGLDGTLSSLNSANARITGYSLEEFDADPQLWRRIVHPEDQTVAERFFAEQAGKVDRFDVEYRLRNKDDTWRWIQSRMVAARDAAGTITGYNCIDRDITEQKQAQMEVERYRRDLEALVEQRTRELEESRAQLRQSERLASLGTLAAGLAHEINNPVGLISLGAENALATPEALSDPDYLRRTLERIVNNARRCGQITKSMLQFARQQPSEKWPTDLNATVADATRAARIDAKNHGSEIRVNLTRGLPQVVGNPIQLQQVFANLLRNAIQASHAGQVVTITTERTEKGVRARVIDEGRGLSPEERAHLFDPFYTTRREAGGTGLGLSIIHGIITEHDGRITVRSERGRGSEFAVELPSMSD